MYVMKGRFLFTWVLLEPFYKIPLLVVRYMWAMPYVVAAGGLESGNAGNVQMLASGGSICTAVHTHFACKPCITDFSRNIHWNSSYMMTAGFCDKGLYIFRWSLCGKRLLYTDLRQQEGSQRAIRNVR